VLPEISTENVVKMQYREMEKQAAANGMHRGSFPQRPSLKKYLVKRRRPNRTKEAVVSTAVASLFIHSIFRKRELGQFLCWSIAV